MKQNKMRIVSSGITTTVIKTLIVIHIIFSVYLMTTVNHKTEVIDVKPTTTKEKTSSSSSSFIIRSNRTINTSKMMMVTKVRNPGTYTCEIGSGSRREDDVNMKTNRDDNNDTNNTTVLSLPKVPDFIIIGTQKGGTTALQCILRKHPNIIPAHGYHKLRKQSTKPEPHFFDQHSQLRISSPPMQGGGGKSYIKLKQKQIYDKLAMDNKNHSISTFLCENRKKYIDMFFNYPQIEQFILFMNESSSNAVSSSSSSSNNSHIGSMNIKNNTGIQKIDNNNLDNNSISDSDIDSSSFSSFYTFEKTPSYIIYPTIPKLIYTVCPWAKIIVILRNPIDRYYSSYKFLYSRVSKSNKFHPYKNKTFEEVINYELELLRLYGLTNAPPKLPIPLERKQNHNISLSDFTNDNYSFAIQNFTLIQEKRKHNEIPDTVFETGLHIGYYANQIMDFMEYFPMKKENTNNSNDNDNSKLLILFYEQFMKDPQKELDKIHDFIGLPYHAYSQEDLLKNYSPVVPILPSKIQEYLKLLRNNNTSSNNNKLKENNKEVMNSDTRVYLQKFYKPYNDELIQRILGEENEEFLNSIWY